jgi:hypothetical protein
VSLQGHKRRLRAGAMKYCKRRHERALDSAKAINGYSGLERNGIKPP